MTLCKVNRQCRRLAIALVALLALATLAIPMGTGYAADATGELETLRNRALELVNKDRREHGLEPLKLEGELNQVAQSHSEDMRGRGYYAHESPEGDTVRDRYIEAGGSRSHIVAENIARCEGCPAPPTLNDVERLHRGWMDSPRHRKNILK